MNCSERECYTCGQKLFFEDLLYVFYMSYLNRNFDREMLYEIWENKIFVLECCTCHKIRKENSTIKELLKYGEIN